jgi:hypothetical protein
VPGGPDRAVRFFEFRLPIAARVDTVRGHSRGWPFPIAALLFFAEVLIGSAQPGILPAHGNILEVAPESDVVTIAVAGFHALVLAHGN